MLRFPKWSKVLAIESRLLAFQTELLTNVSSCIRSFSCVQPIFRLTCCIAHYQPKKHNWSSPDGTKVKKGYRVEVMDGSGFWKRQKYWKMCLVICQISSIFTLKISAHNVTVNPQYKVKKKNGLKSTDHFNQYKPHGEKAVVHQCTDPWLLLWVGVEMDSVSWSRLLFRVMLLSPHLSE